MTSCLVVSGVQGNQQFYMQRRPPSQTNSTLGYTPNPYISHTGNSTFVLPVRKATLVPTLFFAFHKLDSASTHFKRTLCFAPASFSLVHFASHASLRFDRRLLKDVLFSAWFLATWLVFTTPWIHFFDYL